MYVIDQYNRSFQITIGSRIISQQFQIFRGKIKGFINEPILEYETYY